MTQPPSPVEWYPDPDGSGGESYPPTQTLGTARKSWKTDPRKVWLAVAAGILVLVVAFVAGIAVLRSSQESGQRKIPANSGPLTGVFSVEFGPETEMGKDSKVLNPLGAHGTLEIRSACTPAGCMAVAKSNGGPLLNRTLIFDQIGDQWVSVGVAPSNSPAVSAGLNADCEQGLSPEIWETLTLQSHPNEWWSGQYEVTNANNCNALRTVNLKRTGDVVLDNVDDPGLLAPRNPSPARGFRGRYRYTYRSAMGSSHDVEGAVQTRCLHSGDRCMSYFNEENSGEPFVFGHDQWALSYNAPVHCGSADGPRVRITRNAQLALPSSPADPIQLLEGQGLEEVTGVLCRVPAVNYYLRFERIGD